MPCNQLMPQHLTALLVPLREFSALKHLDVSANPGLWLLPVGVLQIVADLDTFNCDCCSLVLPPQNLFSTPRENPGHIQKLLQGQSTTISLNISALDLTPAVAIEVAEVLKYYHALEHLDVSANPELDCGAVASIVGALSGKR